MTNALKIPLKSLHPTSQNLAPERNYQIKSRLQPRTGAILDTGKGTKLQTAKSQVEENAGDRFTLEELRTELSLVTISKVLGA